MEALVMSDPRFDVERLNNSGDNHKVKLTEVIIKAVEIMENVANTTKDMESFKQLTIGFNTITDLLNKVDTSPDIDLEVSAEYQMQKTWNKNNMTKV